MQMGHGALSVRGLVLAHRLRGSQTLPGLSSRGGRGPADP